MMRYVRQVTVRRPVGTATNYACGPFVLESAQIYVEEPVTVVVEFDHPGDPPRPDEDAPHE